MSGEGTLQGWQEAAHVRVALSATEVGGQLVKQRRAARRADDTPTGVARPCILHNRDIPLKPHLADGTLSDAFAHLFQAMLNRNTNDAWQGFHYVDYDLRWDRMERPEGTPVPPLLPVLPTGAAGPSCARASTGER